MSTLAQMIENTWPISREAFLGSHTIPALIVHCAGDGQSGDTTFEDRVVHTDLSQATWHPLMIYGGESLSIGRGERCDITIPDACVSKRHAEIWRQGNVWYIQDSGSTNGTMVGDVELSRDPVVVSEGKRIQFGKNAWALFVNPVLLFSMLEQLAKRMS